ncbi:hypothetical protein FHR83_006702 [Actinoplanes campanulatus]|uniref:Uncharacterized protein n=1 Tax=Actinoplanes campanulatus TaxID=113559 RepID=A0A7W5FHU3_9ACTN|nr:hypothetical protein [Actinoplanes campanulatus]MBB3098996.1 hypothetical protein [Actinoplanes campanulatus]GGN39519.1 hypothetical protein GCM10010109_67540 [Actinoplanes campanulatus]GID40156.1 hypothetical protein Aca09nite_66620 [Actinoplanes campanulatus]
MSVGISTTHSHAVLNVLRGTNYTAPASVWLKLHTGDPASAGTSNASAETTRKQVTFGSPSAGSSVASAVSWTSWSAGSETITHVSLWDASTSGNFLMSAALSASKSVANGDTLNVTVTATQGTLAA